MMLLVCAPLIAVVLHGAWEDRRRAKADWESQVDNISQIAADQEKEVIASTRQLLLSISVIADVQRLEPAAATSCLRGIHKSYARYANLGLVTTNGDLVASVVPAVTSNFAGFNFFRRTLNRQEFTVGNAILPGNNRPRLFFAYPVRSSAGNKLGVVYAALDLNLYCRDAEVSRKLPPDTTWTEVDRRGKVLAFYGPGPQTSNKAAGRLGFFQPERLGRRLTDSWLLTNSLDQFPISVEGDDSQGVAKVFAVTKLKSRFVPGNVMGILAVPRASLFAEANVALSRNLTAFAIAAAVALVLGWIGSTLLILRPVRALAHSSTQLAAGNLSVRTGLKPTRDELGQLTWAFDQMAAALENRELEHRRASQKLQVLSQRLVEVQEAERRHIARELHDEIGQSLTAAELNLQAALQAPPAALLQVRLEDSIKAVERVLEQVHDLSLSLRPSMLDDLGLEPALRWYVHRQAALTGLRADFTAAPLDERLDPLVETECFRVAQEALTNVVRHAQARAVQIELSRSDDLLHLCVRDDGIGFDVNLQHDEAVRGASLGLLSMEERTSLAGGGLEFTSAPGNGTEVHAWFPLRPRNGDLQTASQFNE